MNRRLSLTFLMAGVLTAAIAPAQNREQKIISRLEIYDIESGTRTVLKEYPYSIEAPNWTVDGRYLIYNSKGRIHRIEISAPDNDTPIDTGSVTNCNNDHVLSADGLSLAVSSGAAPDGKSRIFTLPLAGVGEGGEPKLITPLGPSYLHGWSPDGKMLAYCAEREDNYDIYAIPADGGEEIRLTEAEGLDDGPEYTPNGSYIWFNSVRSGLMQIWRMKADGSEQTQITLDTDRNSWFPHVSPDGTRVVYIAYAKGDVAPGDHPAGRNVELRLIPAHRGGEARTVVKLFGGQGTINVNSWAPDSQRFAFVSYEYIQP